MKKKKKKKKKVERERKETEKMKADYEERIKALSNKLAAIQPTDKPGRGRPRKSATGTDASAPSSNTNPAPSTQPDEAKSRSYYAWNAEAKHVFLHVLHCTAYMHCLFYSVPHCTVSYRNQEVKSRTG